MEERYYSVEEISKALKIHEKTVQRYVRERKIKAAKMGKSWRISKSDFDKFLEEFSNIESSMSTDSQSKGFDKIKISSVIDIDVSGANEAMMISNGITASLNSKPEEYGKTSMSAQFLESQNVLRLIFWGNIKVTKILMEMLEGYIGK